MGCFNSVKPRVLELLTLVFTVVAIGFLIWGIIDIPWDDISTAGKIFYYIGCVFVVLVLLFLLVLMCLRIGNKINGPRNGAGICLCITMMVCEILAIIIFVIAEIIIFVNMGDKDDEYWDNNYYNGRRRWRSKYNWEEWWSAVCSVSAAEIAMGLNIATTDYLLKVIRAKCSTCYSDYLETQNKNNITQNSISGLGNNLAKSIEIYNAPPQTNQNALTLIGYDKDGHPIYSGSAQYFTQIQPNNATANKQIKK
jgi:hypothetical protein